MQLVVVLMLKVLLVLVLELIRQAQDYAETHLPLSLR
jgi:hypothetical protein